MEMEMQSHLREKCEIVPCEQHINLSLWFGVYIYTPSNNRWTEPLFERKTAHKWFDFRFRKSSFRKFMLCKNENFEKNVFFRFLIYLAVFYFDIDEMIKYKFMRVW